MMSQGVFYMTIQPWIDSALNVELKWTEIQTYSYSSCELD